MTSSERLTVAICTWNRSRLLRRCLERLATAVASPPGGWELLVVNNNCSDDTSKVVSAFSGRLPIRECVESTPGLSHARNRALQEASGKYLLFTDDDALVDADWLEVFAEATARYPNAAAFGGPIVLHPAAPADPDLAAAFRALHIDLSALDYHRDEGPLPPGCEPFGTNLGLNLARARDLRFDPRFGTVKGSAEGGEEIDFVRRLRARGGEVIWVPRMRVEHRVDPSRLTERYFARVARERARSRVRAGSLPTGPSFLGVPLSLVNGCGVAHAIYGLCRFIAPRRVRLVWLGKTQRFLGKLEECRAVQRRRHSSEALDLAEGGR